MDAAYDHIQEETLRPDEVTHTEAQSSSQSNLNTELQEAYKSFSASPWGARLGGFLGTVKKQSETYYKEAQKEAAAASEKGLKGFTGLTSQLTRNVRSMSLEGSEPAKGSVWDDGFSDGEEGSKLPAEEQTPKAAEKKVASSTENADLQESASLISRFRSEATKRLREIEKAEDAADEALLKFGSNVRNFLRDAVTISAPSETTPNSADSASSKAASKKSQVLFESKDSEGKRVIHTTRFDAQLHAVHSSQEGFTVDPKESAEWEKWKDGFDVEAKTDDIARDLEKYESLRRMMERLVPEKVEYAEFWRRYYFLRMVLDQEEGRRRELLKGEGPMKTRLFHWSSNTMCHGSIQPCHFPRCMPSMLR